MTFRRVVVGLFVLGMTGCFNTTWESKVVQPKLVLGGTDVQRTSWPVAIKLGDMDLPRFCKKRILSNAVSLTISCWDMDLLNTAYFVIVSKDRMRFHVTLHHKWESMTDPTRWRVWIEDDQGHRYNPEGVDSRRVKPVTQMWSTRGTDHNTPLYSLTVWRGDGDYVFHQRDLFRRDMRSMTLTMHRPGYTFKYTWSFVEHKDDGLQTAQLQSVEISEQ